VGVGLDLLSALIGGIAGGAAGAITDNTVDHLTNVREKKATTF
jgi:hypothetical protein